MRKGGTIVAHAGHLQKQIDDMDNLNDNKPAVLASILFFSFIALILVTLLIF